MIVGKVGFVALVFSCLSIGACLGFVLASMCQASGECSRAEEQEGENHAQG